MKSLLLAVFLGSTVTLILAESHSMSCSMVNGNWKCREMNDPTGHSAFSSSAAVSGPGRDSSTYEGVGTGSNDGFVWDQSGTGMFSGFNPGGIGNFPGVNPYGGIGVFPVINPSGGAGAFSGMSSDGIGTYSGWNPPVGGAVFSGVNPSDGSDTFSNLNPSDGSDTFSNLNPSAGTSESEDSDPLGDADDSAVYPEVTEPPVFNPSTGGSDFTPVGVPRTFSTAGTGVFPGMINPFLGPVAFAGVPFGSPRAFAGAGIPFIYPGVPGYPLRFPLGGARALAYAGKRK